MTPLPKPIEELLTAVLRDTSPTSLLQQSASVLAQRCNEAGDLAPLERQPLSLQLAVAAHLEGSVLANFFEQHRIQDEAAAAARHRRKPAQSSSVLLALLLQNPNRVDELQHLLIQIHNQVDRLDLRDLDPEAHQRLDDELFYLDVHASFEEEILFASHLLTLPHHQCRGVKEPRRYLLDRSGNLQEELHNLFRARHCETWYRSSPVSMTDLPVELATLLLPLHRKTQSHFVEYPTSNQAFLPLETFGLSDDFVPPRSALLTNKSALRQLAKAEHAQHTGKLHVSLFFYIWLALRNAFAVGHHRVTRFRVDLFAGMATCFGLYYVDFALAWDCLARMQCYGCFHSDRLTLFVAQQRVYTFYGLHQAEHCIFVRLFHQNMLPSASLLFRDSLTWHLESLLAHCENLIFELHLDRCHHSRCTGACNVSLRWRQIERGKSLLVHLRAVVDTVRNRPCLGDTFLTFLNSCLAKSHMLEGFLWQCCSRYEYTADRCFKVAFGILEATDDLPNAVLPYSYLTELYRKGRFLDPGEWTMLELEMATLGESLDEIAKMKYSYLRCQAEFSFLLACLCLFGRSPYLMERAQHVCEIYAHLSDGRHHRVALLKRALEYFSDNLVFHYNSSSLEFNFLGYTDRFAAASVSDALRRKQIGGEESDRAAILNYLKTEPVLLPRILQFAFAAVRRKNRS